MGWDESDVVVDGVRLHVYRRGRGPTVVLAHGSSDNGLCWTPFAEAVEDSFELIAYDARLHGQSEDGNDEDARRYEVRGTDFVGIIEALGLRHVAAMGHSMGAGAAALAIGMRPDRFRCAILEDPRWFDGELPLRRENPTQTATGLAQQLSDVQRLTAEEIAALGRQQHPDWAEAELSPWALAKKQYRRRPGPPRAPWRDVVAKIARPVLVLCGQPGASIVSEAAEQEAPQLSPSVRIVRLPTGHNVRREAFEEFVSLSRDFLVTHL